MERKFKQLINKIKNQEQKKIAIISYWIADFPCKEYFKKSHCILEDLTPEQLYKFVEQKCKQKQK